MAVFKYRLIIECEEAEELSAERIQRLRDAAFWAVSDVGQGNYWIEEFTKIGG